jgi:hypothetical protein
MSSKTKTWLIAAGAFVVLVGLCIWGTRQLLTGRDLEAGLSALAAAERLSDGSARQERLAEAHDRFAAVLTADRRRTAAWLGRARVQYLGSRSTPDRAESQALLAASAEAAAEAQRRDPSNPRASAIMAQALAALGERGPARAALAESYARAPLALDLARDRVATGLALWSILPPDLQQAVKADLCGALQRAADAPDLIEAWAAASRGEPQAAVVLTTQAGDAACTAA